MKMASSFHSCLLVACALPFLVPLPTTQALSNGLASQIYEFTFGVYKKISESNVDENVLFSPTSIYIALAMLHAGADGETKSQLASALHLDSVQLDTITFNERIHMLTLSLGSWKKGYTLKIVNRLFGQEGFDFKGEYLHTTNLNFHAELEALDFRNDPSGSRSRINRWVAMMTSNKIKELFPEDAITSSTVLALANAVYFSGSWMYRFDKENTKPQTFYLSNGEEIEVPMMNMLSPERLGYYSSETFACQVLELPFSEAKVSTIIVLPNEVDGLALLEEELPNNSMADMFYSLRKTLVMSSLPKFKLQQTLNLKETLQALGIDNLFENADLSGIDDSGELVLSEAIHKAYIAVDEDGMEAAAATGIKIEHVSHITANQEPISFIVDRPFLFLMVDQATGAILFVGRVTNPLEFN